MTTTANKYERHHKGLKNFSQLMLYSEVTFYCERQQDIHFGKSGDFRFFH